MYGWSTDLPSVHRDRLCLPKIPKLKFTHIKMQLTFTKEISGTVGHCWGVLDSLGTLTVCCWSLVSPWKFRHALGLVRNALAVDSGGALVTRRLCRDSNKRCTWLNMIHLVMDIVIMYWMRIQDFQLGLGWNYWRNLYLYTWLIIVSRHLFKIGILIYTRQWMCLVTSHKYLSNSCV